MSDIDELGRIFSSSLKTPNDDHQGHKLLYKNRSNSSCQDERRRHILLLQREKRQALINENRTVDDHSNLKRKISSVWNQEINFIKQQNIEREEWFKQTHVYSNSLMFSEWLLELSEDFANWIMVPCPKGKRNLVVSRMNYATSYTKYGKSTCTFKCQLPRNTMLDCIFCQKTNTFYVLDILQWNGHCLRNCQTDFRFYWLASKFDETPELNENSEKNEYAIKVLDRSKCQECTLSEAMSRYPMFSNNVPELDGLLFYHPEVFYSPGATPLVGWLKPFMVPEVLSISVTEKYLEEKPHDYKTVNEYIEWFNLQSKNSTRKKKHGRNKMMKMNFDGQEEDNVSDLSINMSLEMKSENTDNNSLIGNASLESSATDSPKTLTQMEESDERIDLLS